MEPEKPDDDENNLNDADTRYKKFVEFYGGVYVGHNGESFNADNFEGSVSSVGPKDRDSKSDQRSLRSERSPDAAPGRSSAASKVMRQCTFSEYIADETHFMRRPACRQNLSKSGKGPECPLYIIDLEDETASVDSIPVQVEKSLESKPRPPAQASELDRIDVLSVRTLNQNDLVCLPCLEPSLDSETRSAREFEAARLTLITNLILIVAFLFTNLLLAILSDPSQSYYRVILFSCQKGAMPILTAVTNLAIVKNVVQFYLEMFIRKV